MSDYDRTLELVNVAQNSQGRANEQFAKYADTVEYRVNKLKNAWEEFRTSLVDSDIVKGILTAAKSVLSFISQLINSIPKLTVVIITLVKLFKQLKGLVPTAKNIANAFLKAYKEAGMEQKLKINGDEAAKKIKKAEIEGANYHARKIKEAIIESLPNLPGSKVGNNISSQNWNRSRYNLALPNSQSEQLMLPGPVQKVDLKTRIKNWFKSDQKFMSAGTQKAMKFASNAASAASSAASTATIGLIIGTAINETFESINEGIKQAFDSAISQSQATFNISEYKNAKSSTQTLEDAKNAVETLSNQTYLSSEKEEELANAVDLFREKYPEYIKSYDENTGKLTLLSDKLNEEIAVQKENNEILLAANLGKEAYGRASGYDEVSRQISENKYDTSDFGKWVNNNADSISTYSAAGLGAAGAVAGGAIGAAIGSAVPVIGTIIGGAIGLLLGGLTGALAQEFATSTTTITEFIGQINSLDAQTQKTLFQELNEQYKLTGKEQITTIAELQTYVSNNTDKIAEIGETTQSILKKIGEKDRKEDTLKASQDYMSTWEFGEDKEKLPQELIERGHNQLTTRTEIVGTDLYNIVDANIEKTKDGTFGHEVDVIADAFDAAGKLDELTRIEEVLDDMGKLPETFGEGMTQDQINTLKDLEPFWNSLKNQEVENITSQVVRILAEVYSGESLEAALDKEVKPVFEKIMLSDSAIVKSAMDFIENFNTKARTMTIQEMQNEGNRLITQIQTLSIGDTSKENAQIREILINYITGKTANGYDEGSLGKVEQIWLDKAAQFREDFGNEIVDSMSIESLTLLDNLTKEYKDSANWEPMKNGIRHVLEDVQDKIKDKTIAASITDYIIGNLSPKNFDIFQTAKYTEELGKMAHNARLAGEWLNYLNGVYLSNNIKTKQYSLEEFTEQLDDYKKELKSKISDWNSFKKVFEASLTKEGAAPEDLIDLIDSNYYDSLQENGVINLKAGTEAAINDAVNFYSDRYNKYIQMLQKAEGDALQTAIVENWWKSTKQVLDALKQQAIDYSEEVVEKYQEDYEKALKAAHKSERDVRNAERKEKEAEEAYNEALNGSPYWIPSISALHNFEREIDNINNDLDITELQLKDITSASEALDLVNQRNVERHDLEVQTEAELVALRESYNKKLEETEQLAAEYGISDHTNLEELMTADVPQKIRDLLAQENTELTERNKKIQELEKDQLERRQQYAEEEKDLLNKRVSFLKKGADIMKEAAEEEVKDLKNKYEAMKDADDQYLDALEDAIERQRHLRDREKAANDLATKEKKLSLMSRDTSGANEKERLKLEKEIQEDRQKNLDTAVDDLITELKKQSEEREKERQAVVDATEAVNEATNWTQQFCAIAESWTTTEQAETWFGTIAPNLNKITAEERQQLSNELVDSFKEALPYMAVNMKGYKGMAAVTDAEVASALEAGKSALELYDAREIAKAQKDAADDIYNTKDAWENAKDSLYDAEKAQIENNENLEKARYALDNATAQLAELNGGVLKDLSDYYESEKNDRVSRINADFNANKSLAGAEEIGNLIQNTSTSQAQEFAKQYREATGLDKEVVVEKARKAGYSLVDGNFYVNQSGLDKMSSNLAWAEYYNKKYQSAANEATKKAIIQEGMGHSLAFNNGKFYDSEADELKNSLLQVGGFFQENEANKLKSVWFGGLDNIYNKGIGIESQKTALEQKFEELRMTSSFNDPYASSDYYEINSPKGEKRYIDSYEDAKYFAKNGYAVYHVWPGGIISNGKRELIKYATGGLVNYTGLAQVDGTPRKPEAFLSAEDTRRIGNAAKLFATSPLLNSFSTKTPISSSIGDTSIEININVENISNDYDVDRLTERVHQNILDAARPTGTPVILRKN